MKNINMVCIFIGNGCKSKNDECKNCDPEACGEWQKKMIEKKLCPIMLKCGYPEKNALCQPELLDLREKLPVCYTGTNCLIVNLPEAQARYEPKKIR